MMEHDYQRMGIDERTSHHDDLRDEGYEWCPECGETLMWDLPDATEPLSTSGLPVICGDCPPLTREELATTTPPTRS